MFSLLFFLQNLDVHVWDAAKVILTFKPFKRGGTPIKLNTNNDLNSFEINYDSVRSLVLH